MNKYLMFLIVISLPLLANAGLTLVAPAGGEILMADQTVPITWTSTDSISNVMIEYSVNGGLDWIPIVIVSNTGFYDWVVPPVDSTECIVRVSGHGNPGINDTSDSPFTIFECRLESPADLNNDCKTDLADFALMAADWLRNGNRFDGDFTEEHWGGVIPEDSIITIDGDASEWTDAAWKPLDIVYAYSPTDVSDARFALKWNESTKKIYVIVEVVDVDHVFSDEYISWNASDRLEIYCQANTEGGLGYNDVYAVAQKYYIAPDTTGGSWATWGGTGQIVGSDAGLEYAVKVTGSRIVYEVGVTLFKNYGGFDGTANVVKDLNIGDVIGFDVVVCSRHTDGFGMLSTNELTGKYADAGKFARYKLADMEDKQPGKNPSFEGRFYNGVAEFWSGTLPSFQGEAHSGNKGQSYKMSGVGFHDNATYGLGIYQVVTDLKPGQLYNVSVWCKGVFSTDAWDYDYYQTVIIGTYPPDTNDSMLLENWETLERFRTFGNRWRQYSMNFQPSSDSTTLFIGNQGYGEASYYNGPAPWDFVVTIDEVKIVEVIQ